MKKITIALCFIGILAVCFGSVVPELLIVNQSINNKYISLPVIQLVIPKKINNNNVTFEGLENFDVVRESVYQIRQSNLQKITTQFVAKLTLKPKQPGKYFIKAIIKTGKTEEETNKVEIDVSKEVFEKIKQINHFPKSEGVLFKGVSNK